MNDVTAILATLATVFAVYTAAVACLWFGEWYRTTLIVVAASFALFALMRLLFDRFRGES